MEARGTGARSGPDIQKVGLYSEGKHITKAYRHRKHAPNRDIHIGTGDSAISHIELGEARLFARLSIQRTVLTRSRMSFGDAPALTFTTGAC